MSLRRQRKGFQKPWKLEDIRDGLEEFYKVHGRYPTSREFDEFDYLPSSRQIQRRFGGLVGLREELSLSGQTDFTKGDHSSKRARSINKRAHEVENKVYTYLKDLFGAAFVHREHQFVDDGRSRTDFFIYDKDGNFSVDVFYPRDRHNLIGCLNTKLKKYKKDALTQYPVIFLQMNKEINQIIIEDILKNKKQKLKEKQHLMDWEMFVAFCQKRAPLELK